MNMISQTTIIILYIIINNYNYKNIIILIINNTFWFIFINYLSYNYYINLHNVMNYIIIMLK